MSFSSGARARIPPERCASRRRSTRRTARPITPDPSSDATRLSFSAAASGVYNVLIADDIRIDGKQTGAYAIHFARVNNPCNAQPLDCGSVSQGRIDGVMRFSTYSIAADNGDAFLVRLLRADLNTSFKPRLEIYDPLGRLVQIGSTTDLARFTFKAGVAGVYTVLAGDGLDGTRTGAYSVSLARLNRPCNAAPLGCASLAAGSIGGPLQFTSYAYTAAAGESFTVRMLDPNGSLQEAVEVYDPEGNPAGTSVPGNVQAVDVLHPAAGAYTIVAMDAGKTAGQGPFALQLYRTRNACAPPAAQGAPLRGVVTGSAPFTAYSLAAAAGDALLVRSASLTENFNAGMDLYDAEGARVASGTFALTAAVKTAGSYTLIVGASAPRTAGAYALSWQAMNRPANVLPLGCGQTAGGALSPGAQFRYYSAPADAGDTLRLLLTRLSDGFSPQMELYEPAGKRLALTTTDLTRKVADAGNYVIVLSPGTTMAETGGYALAFQKINRPCGAVALACGQSVLRTAEAPGQLDAITFAGAAGERMSLRLPTRSGNFSPFIELYDPAGYPGAIGGARLAHAYALRHRRLRAAGARPLGRRGREVPRRVAAGAGRLPRHRRGEAVHPLAAAHRRRSTYRRFSVPYSMGIGRQRGCGFARNPALHRRRQHIPGGARHGSRRRQPILRLAGARQHRSEPHGGDSSDRHGCSRQFSLGRKRPARAARRRLHTELHCHVRVRRPESCEQGQVRGRAACGVHLRRVGQFDRGAQHAAMSRSYANAFRNCSTAQARSSWR